MTQRVIKLGEEKDADKWKTLPKGWDKESLESFWESIGDSVSACMTKAEDFTDDPAAFCASLKDKMEGKKWRHEPRK